MLNPQAVDVLSSERKLSKKRAKLRQTKEPLEHDSLSFLAALVEALHSEAGSYPLDSVVKALSEQHLQATLESRFELAVAADSPALVCSVRAVQVLLRRMHTHWKVHV